MCAAAAFTLETSAPAGFEDLTEPESLVADIYFGGRPVGTAQISVDLHTVQFSHPEAVFKLLPETLQPDAVLSALSEAQPRNSNKVCRLKSQLDCGYLVPESVGLIYDDSRFRVDIFIAPSLLPQQSAIASPYLPDATSEFSFIQNLTGTWSGVDSNLGPTSQSASLFGTSILSFGESGLHSQWSATDEGNPFIHELHWTRDYQGKAYSIGLLQPESYFSSFIPSPYIYGVEYRSSNNSRADNFYREGTPLEINMPTRGRVEIHRDNRLIYSSLVEAGNQLLDTSNLPGGAYEVEILTFDEGGRPLNRFTQFFAKDALLPPSGEWSWELLAGKPASSTEEDTLPDRADTYYLKGSLARRVSDNAGVFTTAASTDHEQVLEVGTRWIQENFELSPSAIYGSTGSRGYRVLAQLHTPYFDLGASETRITGTPEDSVAAAPYSILNRDTFNRSLTLSSQMFGGRAAIRHSESNRQQSLDSAGVILDDDVGSADKLTTFEFQRSMLRSRFWYGDFSFSHSIAEGEQQLTALTFQFRYRGERWSSGSTLRYDRDESGNGVARAGLNSSWNDRDLWAYDVSQQFSAEAAEDDYYLGSQTRVAGRRGYLTSTLAHRNNRDSDLRTTNYLGSFSTSLMTSGDAFSWGGERTLNSAVIVDINGSEGQDFEILVDGTRRGYAKGGSQSVISLPSFRTYELSLRPLADGFYDYRESRETITLYPGNVATTDYQVQTLIVVLGRLVNGDTPLRNTRISIGEYSAVTDDYGVFQIEIHGTPQTLRVPPVQWGDCRVDIPEQSAADDWINIGIVDLAKAQCPIKGASYARQ
ncbi:TcfC E-set like domain-containing protein [Microbulbifer pacificus]|uniref:TcfC E-set like domain-containing protein n=1 Tax=Microbulbifer pacificus TaxID=407164 RepID=A0AAU0MVZ8_9GAMM|nr:TcfC E-set like domain-containing protein [Microbulbifer pacificus]WOX04820.1 TcfC E-set like domain-containing protein [Microbulbifer pacificus]